MSASAWWAGCILLLFTMVFVSIANAELNRIFFKARTSSRASWASNSCWNKHWYTLLWFALQSSPFVCCYGECLRWSKDRISGKVSPKLMFISFSWFTNDASALRRSVGTSKVDELCPISTVTTLFLFGSKLYLVRNCIGFFADISSFSASFFMLLVRNYIVCSDIIFYACYNFHWG